MGAQQSRAEAVDRADVGGVDAAAVRPPAVRLVRCIGGLDVRVAQIAEAVLQLTGRLLGEGDGDDPRQLGAPLRQQPRQTVDQRGCLAAACAGLQQDVVALILDRPPSGGLIGRISPVRQLARSRS
jgi:hypothetical protein